jgi:ATP-dependent exoDNAse (exonuclease V) alpha subunit
MIPNKVVITVLLRKKSEEKKVYFPFREQPVILKIKPYAVEFGIPVTIHKMQGQTCERLILDLNKRPFSPQIELHGLYVALSRVKQSRNLRLLPLQPLQTNLNYLFN